MIYLGIDNGVSGSVGYIWGGVATYVKMPVNRVLNYTKSKQWLHRIDGQELSKLLKFSGEDCYCMIERPMVNPGRWKATMSAMRAMEATLIVLELLKIPYQFIDSKEWQKALLPSGLEKEELKTASRQVGTRLFPNMQWGDFKDADGLLIAEYNRRAHK